MPIQFEASKESLARAYQRVKHDRPSRCFVEYPRLFDFIDTDKNVLFDELRAKVASGYQPHGSQMCWVPKPNHLVRPANILHLKDEVVLNLIIGDLYPMLYRNNQKFKDVDIAYPLSPPDKQKWISNSFNAWKLFSTKTLEILDGGYSYVVYSDITGFYENIEIKKLIIILKRICGEMPQIDLLSTCLNSWSNRGGAGIPQGYTGSDILAKTFANSLDEMLLNDGFRHLRYVDDFRIFCRTKTEAQKAILALSKYVHTIGLNLQSTKTMIHTKAEVTEEISGITREIDEVRKDLVEEFAYEILNYSEYPNSEEAQELALAEYPEDSTSIFEKAFIDNFLTAEDGVFNKSLFRFLIKRLGRVGSKIAVSYCLESLTERPEETINILGYLVQLELSSAETTTLIESLTSDRNIYDYQKYQLLKWFLDNDFNNQRVVNYSRSVMKDLNKDPWLRAYAIVYLGKFGNESDLSNFEYQFTQEASPVVRAHCIEACKRGATVSRNAFYSRIVGQNSLYGLAVAYSRNQ